MRYTVTARELAVAFTVYDSDAGAGADFMGYAEHTFDDVPPCAAPPAEVTLRLGPRPWSALPGRSVRLRARAASAYTFCTR